MFNNGNSANFNYKDYFIKKLKPLNEYIIKEPGWLSLTTTTTYSKFTINLLIILEDIKEFDPDFNYLFLDNGKNILDFCNNNKLILPIFDIINIVHINNIINSMDEIEFYPTKNNTKDILFIYNIIPNLNINKYLDFFDRYDTISCEFINKEIIIKILKYNNYDFNLELENVSILFYILYFYKNSNFTIDLTDLYDIILKNLIFVNFLQKINNSKKFQTYLLLIDTIPSLALIYLSKFNDKIIIDNYIKFDIDKNIIDINSLNFLLTYTQLDVNIYIKILLKYYNIVNATNITLFNNKKYYEYLFDINLLNEDQVDEIKKMLIDIE
jgi:hypothetical protein